MAQSPIPTRSSGCRWRPTRNKLPIAIAIVGAFAGWLPARAQPANGADTVGPSGYQASPEGMIERRMESPSGAPLRDPQPFPAPMPTPSPEPSLGGGNPGGGPPFESGGGAGGGFGGYGGGPPGQGSSLQGASPQAMARPRVGSGFRITEQAASDGASSSETALNLPRQISNKIASCWRPPALDPPRGISATVRLSFTAAGMPIGPPVITYVDVPPGNPERPIIAQSVLDSVEACVPLRFTRSLASAIAGQVFTIRLISLKPGKQKAI